MRPGLSLCLVTLCIAARSSKEPPTVTIPEQGTVVGREQSVTRSQRATVFLGIPYASPPKVRFSPPQTRPLPEWDNVRNASQYAAACPQSKVHLKKLHKLFSDALPEELEKITFDEDCLYLNIFIPDGTPPASGWPVMVWFHPGEFITGATSLWEGSVLAVKQKVMVITVGYRLNVFGFLTVSDGVSTGNYGLLDQVAALDWIQAKISAFKGSPSSVCLFGYGAGGISAGLHMLSPRSSGKFDRAIAMSGNALIHEGVKMVKTQEEYALLLGKRFSCDEKPISAVVECLRTLDAMTLAEEATNIGPWGPVVDYELYNESSNRMAFLHKSPEQLFEEGEFSKVDFMTGYTDMEDAFYYIERGIDLDKDLTNTQLENYIIDIIDLEIQSMASNTSCDINAQHIYDTVTFYYSPQPYTTDVTALRNRLMDFRTEKTYGSSAYKQATYLSKSATTYLYRFDYKPKKGIVTLPDWVKVPHQFDIPFVWGMPYWPTLNSFLWNNADRKFAEHIMMMWANFAKYSNPIQSGFNIKWEPFTAEVPGFMILDRYFNMSDGMSVDYKAFTFWNSYYPKVKEMASSMCCNITAQGTNLHSELNATRMLTIIGIIHYIVAS